MIALILAMAVMAAVFIPWAVRNDNAGELWQYERYEADPTLTEQETAA